MYGFNLYLTNFLFLCYSYKHDETSPIDDYESEYPYEILSKLNRRLLPDAPVNTAVTKSAHQHASPLASLMMHNQCCSSPHCH